MKLFACYLISLGLTPAYDTNEQHCLLNYADTIWVAFNGIQFVQKPYYKISYWAWYKFGCNLMIAIGLQVNTFF